MANGAAVLPPGNSTINNVDAAGYFLISQDCYTAATPAQASTTLTVAPSPAPLAF